MQQFSKKIILRIFLCNETQETFWHINIFESNLIKLHIKIASNSSDSPFLNKLLSICKIIDKKFKLSNHWKIPKYLYKSSCLHMSWKTFRSSSWLRHLPWHILRRVHHFGIPVWSAAHFCCGRVAAIWRHWMLFPSCGASSDIPSWIFCHSCLCPYTCWDTWIHSSDAGRIPSSRPVIG